MSKAAKKTSIAFSLVLIFSFFSNVLLSSLFFSYTVQADERVISPVDSVSNETVDVSMSAEIIINHNKRLLNSTTIGDTLSTTVNKQAKALYQKALTLHSQAIASYDAGQNELAKALAFQSIDAFYESDRVHYNLHNK